MNVLDDAINAFLTVLRSSWTDVERALVKSAGWDESAIYDWAQASWEQIVEAAMSREKRVVLEVYAAGADCNAGSSRVWMPARVPTHGVVCVPRGTDAVLDKLSHRSLMLPSDGLLLDEFVTMDGGWYKAAPPFDHVLVRGESGEIVVLLSDLSFSLTKIRALASD